MKHSKYRPDIDGLRAVAVLSVVAFHAFPGNRTLTFRSTEFVISPFGGGFVGVDIFFVISGFLISTIILQNLQRDTFSIIDFYRRRVRRIFPALGIVLLSCLITGWLFLFADEFRRLGKDVAAGAGFVSNIALWGENGYFDNIGNTKPLQHLWSLGIEEQYYLVWPLFLWTLYKTKAKATGFILAACLVSFALNAYFTRVNSIEAFYAPYTRFWELFVGSILAYWSLESFENRLTVTSRAGREMLAIAGSVLIGAALLFINKTQPFPGFLALLPTLGTALVISAGPDTSINRNLLSRKVVVWFGLISYPLYLWHWPVLTFLRIFQGTRTEISNEKRAIAIVISILLAWLTYHLIEKPLRYGPNASGKAITLLGVVLLLGVFGFEVFLHNGYVARIHFVPPQGSILFRPYPHPLHNLNCATVYPVLENRWSCLLSKPVGADVAIIGDSHAHQYYQSLAKSLSTRSVLNFSGCLPFAAVPLLDHDCVIDQTDALKFLTAHPEIRTVYIAGYFSYRAAGDFQFGNIEGLRRAARLTDDEKRSFIDNGTFILQALLAAEKDVVVIRDIPDLMYRPVSCLQFKSARVAFVRSSTSDFEKTADGDCSLNREAYERRIAPYDSALSQLLGQFPMVRVFDPRPILCDLAHCWIIRGGVPLYWDSDHLTLEGTDAIVSSLLSLDPPLY
jgi:peptidoglycan/LPS O-acetylase OafA/YrhL